MFEDILDDWPVIKEEDLSEEEMKALAKELYEEAEEEDCDCDGSCAGCGHGTSVLTE